MDHRLFVAGIVLASFSLCISILSFMTWHLYKNQPARSIWLLDILGCFRPVLGLATLPLLLVGLKTARFGDVLIWCAILSVICCIFSEVGYKLPLF